MKISEEDWQYRYVGTYARIGGKDQNLVLEEDTGEQLENVLQPEDGEELDEWIVEELQLLATGFPMFTCYLSFTVEFQICIDLNTDPDSDKRFSRQIEEFFFGNKFTRFKSQIEIKTLIKD